MSASYERTAWWIPAICLLLLIGWKVDSVQAVSIDMAHHYALVERLAEKWRFAAADDPAALAVDWRSLGEMIHYPALAHRFAAIIGRVLNSSFIGMQVVAVAAAAIIWAGIGAALFAVPRNAAIVAAMVTATLLAVTTRVFHLPAHGGEVVEAYFFAQLVGQAFAFLCVRAWVVEERRGEGVTMRRLLTLAAPFAAASFHLLPALELLAFFGCAALFDAWTSQAGHRQRVFIVNCGWLAAGAVLLAVNPSLRAMLDIATNNGQLPLALPDGTGVFAGLAAMVLGLAAVNLVLWRRLSVRGVGGAFAGFKALTLFGAAAALLCLAQVVAERLGGGNDYAVRKYVYSLLTGIAVQAGVLVGSIIALRYGDLRADANADDGKVRAAGLSAFMVVAFCLTGPAAVFQGASTLTARIVGYERQIKALRDAHLPAVDGRYDIVAGLADLPPAAAYMFSLGLMKTPREANAAAILHGRELPEPDQVGSIITSAGTVPYDLSRCRRFVATSGLAVLDGRCYAQDPHQHRRCDGVFNFRQGQSAVNFDHLLFGFSGPEPAGRWTDGNAASFRCHQPDGDRRATHVILETTAFLHPTLGPFRQRATVKVNGRPVADHVFTAVAGEKIFDVPLSISDGPEIEIVIETPDAAAPAELGVGADRRRLGVQVRRIEFSPASAGR